MSNTNSPIIGFEYFLAGFELILKPGVKRYVIFPILLNFIIFIGLFFLLRHFVGELNQWLMHFLPHWLQWLSIIIWITFFIGFLLIFIFAFVTIANLVGAPFHSLLSEKVELHLGHTSLEQKSFWQTLKTIPSSIGRQFSILGFYIPRTIVMLILFFVPIVQMVATVLWFLWNAWFMTLQCIDYPTDNHGVSIRAARVWLEERPMTTLGFGIGVMLMTLIPIVNCIALPAAVAGATKFWIEENKYKDRNIDLSYTLK